MNERSYKYTTETALPCCRIWFFYFQIIECGSTIIIPVILLPVEAEQFDTNSTYHKIKGVPIVAQW